MYIVLLLLLEASVVVSSAVPTHVCPTGTYLFKARPDLEVCIICDDGNTYMDDHWHTHQECFKCTRVVDPQLEVVVRGCNRTHDTLIHCKEGFYRRRARNPRDSDRCVKCVECENPTRLCEGFYDTVCCGHPSYEAVLNKDGVYVCKEKPIVCTQGQYYNPRYEQCLPCLPDTYMSEISHNNTECKLCQNMGNNSSRQLVQACNSTQPAIFKCKSGYFRHSPDETPLSDDDCLPCQTCPFAGRKCTQDSDTFCCDRPGMKVIDNNTGPVCVPLSADTSNFYNTTGVAGGQSLRQLRRLKPQATGDVTETEVHFSSGEGKSSQNRKACGQNEFVYIINNSLTCQHCREGTYNDDLNHTRTFCRNSSEFSGRQLPNSCHIENDLVKTTYSGMSINKIMCIVSVVSVVLVLVSYAVLSVKLRETVLNYQQDKIKFMHLSELKLLYAVIVHMFCSYILSVFATDITVIITFISILTVFLFFVDFFVLYQIWNQNKGTHAHFSTKFTNKQVTERLNSTDTDNNNVVEIMY